MSIVRASGMAPYRETRPYVGRKPVVPLTTITASTVRSLLKGVSRLTRSDGTAGKRAALQAALDAFMAAGHAGVNRIAVLVNRKIKVGTIAELTKDPDPWIHEYFTGVRGRAALAS